jgi:hypothetical protein
MDWPLLTELPSPSSLLPPKQGGARATMTVEELKKQIYLGVKPGLPKLTVRPCARLTPR